MGQEHALFLQVAPPVHKIPQAPQLMMFEEVSTQSPAHSTVPEGQVQLAEVHGRPMGHATPQAPQLPGSVAMSTHRPLQLVGGDWHPNAQLPPAHA
jgi:hypothetical protein